MCSDILSDQKTQKDIIENRTKWLLKPYLLGKGEGIQFGKNYSKQDWSRLVTEALRVNRAIFQEYINQHQFDVWLSRKNEQTSKNSQLNIVGTMLCLNDQFLGPGLYRAGQGDLIALARGGFFLFPVLRQTKNYANHRDMIVPADSRFYLDSFSFKQAELYKSALLRNGLALVELNFDPTADQMNVFFIDLIKCLGMRPCGHTAKGDDFLWQIRPCDRQTSGPRSHRSDVFCMHTDASFELEPPRYFGLLVVRADRFGGGRTLLIRSVFFGIVMVIVVIAIT